jgi:hypothetical protein
VALWFDVVKGVPDSAFRVDHESGAQDAHAFFSMGLFFTPYIVGFTGHAIDIGQQANGQPVFVAEITVGEAVVAADAEDLGVGAFELSRSAFGSSNAGAGSPGDSIGVPLLGGYDLLLERKSISRLAFSQQKFSP